MFDFGISELAVVAVVALVVIGPERLPKVARTVGTLLGRAQRYVNDVKAEVNREMELDELRKLQTQMQDAARGIQEQVSTAGAEVQSAVHSMEKQLNDGIVPAATPDTAAPQPASPATDPAPIAPVALQTEPAPPTVPSTPDPHSPAAPTAAPAPSADKPEQSSLFPENTIR
ncbi:MAG: Sec-independent protein translocase subunit TatB [Burkholderiales bacterium]|nr:Sec-independent protein translocase subunit TatB [Burkholderiales bacterium]